MFRNYLTIALRNFWRNKVFSLINIAGLAIGISASLVIYMIVHYEFSYENFQKDGDRIFRVVSNMHFPDQDFKNAGVPQPLPDAVRNEIPGIKVSTFFMTEGDMNVKVPVKSENDHVFKKQENIVFADNYYFSLVNYTWMAGSAATALDGPNKVVLTESSVKKYFSFPDVRDAIGRTIIYDTLTATVTGIVKDIETPTNFSFKEFISFSTLTKDDDWSQWGSVSSQWQFWLKLDKGVDPGKINAQLKIVRKRHDKAAYLATDHFLQPMNDVHFNSDFDAFGNRQGHKPTLYGLMAVAVFLLVLGCINFINLTTAQGAQRAKEIGIRKTMGGSKGHLMLQFLIETFLLAGIATLISLLLAPGLLKMFSDFIPPGLSLNLTSQPYLIGFIVVLVLVVSLVSGIYPAFVLSKYKPATVLKNVASSDSAQTRRAWVRKTLTVSQFVIAQFFIIATLIVSKQIRFSLNKDLGFKKNAIINIYTSSKQLVFLEKLKHITGINKISLAGVPPATGGGNSSTMKFINGNKEIETTVEVKYADTNYFSVYNIKLVAGRNLLPSDTVREYVINETYAKFLGYQNPSKIIGQFLDRSGKKYPIVGVIADFHFKSLHKPISPLVFTCTEKNHGGFHIALAGGKNTDQWKTTIARIGETWKDIYPEEDFSYSFFDENIAQFYKKEQETARLLNWSAGLAIFISCLGLLGLVIYTTTHRTKEIGVRKVLGASVTQIVSLLSKDFLLLVALGFLIAAPLAWIAADSWLRDFAYRTSISWWIFAGSGVVMIVIALLTLSIQTIRAAIANPVKSLRTE